MALLRKTSAPAILASLAIHVVAAGAVSMARHVPRLGQDDRAQEVEVELMAPPAPEPAPAVVPEPLLARAATVNAVAPIESAARSFAGGERARPSLPEPSAEGAPTPAPQPADSSAAWTFPRTVADLGIGTYWKNVATNGDPLPAARAEAPPAAPPPLSPNRILRDGLAAHDRALGLGNGGPLVSAAHEAASPSIAPDVGSATFDVDSDATGKVVGAHVVSASAEPSAWNDVAQELVRLMSAKTLKVLHDSRGMRTRLRIVAQRTLPSGAPYARSAGAVPEDACAGEAIGPGGLGRKCNSGMPSGLSQSFDLSDIGARPSRIVRVQLLGEAAL